MFSKLDFKNLSKFDYTKLGSYNWFDVLRLALKKFEKQEIKFYFKSLFEEIGSNLEYAKAILN